MWTISTLRNSEARPTSASSSTAGVPQPDCTHMRSPELTSFNACAASTHLFRYSSRQFISGRLRARIRIGRALELLRPCRSLPAPQFCSLGNKTAGLISGMIFPKTQTILGFAKAPGSDAHHFALPGRVWNTSEASTLSERKVFLLQKLRMLTFGWHILHVILSRSTCPCG
jgi:hypothetical protein